MELARLNFEEAVKQPGCPVCRLRERWVSDYLRQTLSEYVIDGQTQKTLANSQGWCYQHAWELQATAQREWQDGNKIAMLYENASLQLQGLFKRYLQGALDEPSQACSSRAGILGAVIRWITPPRSAVGLLERLQPRQRCPVCTMVERKENLLLHSLGRDQAALADLDRSDGLCLPHLVVALEGAADEMIAQYLIRHASQQLVGLHAHLEAYLEKHRWQENVALRTPAEEASWLRMVAFFVGEAPPASDLGIQQQREQARCVSQRLT